MPVPNPTVDELISALRRATIPTVLVEGKDDMTVYHWIEDAKGQIKANVLPCGGRDKLLELFNRKAEFSSLKSAFLADQDMWLFVAAPQQYNGVIRTAGYSIENDIIDGSVVEKLFSPQEATELRHLVAQIVRWFAFEVEQYRAGYQPVLDVKLGTLIPNSELSTAYLTARKYQEPHATLVAQITSNWKLQIRGKNLLDVLMRILGSTNRQPNYSRLAILEMGTKLVQNPHLNRLSAEIARALN